MSPNKLYHANSCIFVLFLSADSSDSDWHSITGVWVDVLALSLGVTFRMLMSSKLTVGVNTDCMVTSSVSCCSMSLADSGGS